MAEVNRQRITALNSSSEYGPGDIVYWMYREQRLDDNWGLLFALELAEKFGRGIQVICFWDALWDRAPDLARRFMGGGLERVEERAGELGIPFTLNPGPDPGKNVLEFAASEKAAALVCDFLPLRHYWEYCRYLTENLPIPLWEVDSHNIVPCRFVSDKQEYAAFTLRKKIEPLLPEFLVPFPDLEESVGRMLPSLAPPGPVPAPNQDISSLPAPGYHAGMSRLHNFIKEHLTDYNRLSSDPTAHGVSGLSPYLNCGQIAPQTAALEAAGYLGYLELKGGFLDELIVRRELSDNYCFHNGDYDNIGGCPDWARKSLDNHRKDEREYLYTRDELEKGLTHDDLWNAAQRQMTGEGIMHGYMRMYWAKKILEWSADPETAMETAVYLNDKYSLDGRDPNGYAGCAWAVGGLHDRPWKERPVFGMVRYMNSQGCARKFNTNSYIEEVESNG